MTQVRKKDFKNYRMPGNIIGL